MDNKDKSKDNLNPEQQFSDFIEAGKKVTSSIMDNFPSFINISSDLMSVNAALMNLVQNDEKKENLEKVQEQYFDYLKKHFTLWQKFSTKKNGEKIEPVITPSVTDGRFKAEEWNDNSNFDFIKQSYLLMSELINNLTETVDIDAEEKNKLSFFTKQYIDAIAPTNFAFTNPEVLKLAQETNGASLVDGFKNFIKDYEKGHISQTDESAFEIGRNVAITPGTVIYENEIIQLIQYLPTTKTVNQYPLLIIPPCINKYYILDLQPHNSFVKYAVDNGNTVFLISWRNPSKEMTPFTFDDYINDGIFKAVDAVKSITKAKKINALGYCIGGTILGVAASAYKKKKKAPFNSLTFLASMLDFSDIGPVNVFVDEKWISTLEKELKKEGILDGRKLANTFNLLRPNDLIWSYVVNNYLKGKEPRPFDILYWNGDSTNLPGNMYAYYLRHMCLNNELIVKDKLTIAGEKIDLGNIDNPAYIVSCKEDHISPFRTNFNTTELLSGTCEFILSGSGHVAGIVNPPEKSKRGYLTDGELTKGVDHWLSTAKENEGSWWIHWINWINKISEKQISAIYNIGNEDYPPVEPSPGKYVKVSYK